jgi:protein TonB
VLKESIALETPLEPAQPVTEVVQHAPATRANYDWLIESLSARLAELKHYPTAARSSGLEGKVLLRAVIRSDGHLAEVSVQKSSGHEELDAAAMQTMREASPMQLRHTLGRAQIAITVPLVYKLTN